MFEQLLQSTRNANAAIIAQQSRVIAQYAMVDIVAIGYTDRDIVSQ